MKAKKVTGTYKEIHAGFKKFLGEILPELHEINDAQDKVNIDIKRIAFLGDQLDAFKERLGKYQAKHYEQGDIQGSSQFCQVYLLPNLNNKNLLMNHTKAAVSYLNNDDQICGLGFVGHSQDTGLWMMNHTSNSDAVLKDREVTIYLSEEMFTLYNQLLLEKDINDPFGFEDVSFHEDLRERIKNYEVSHAAEKLVTEKGQTNIVMAECWKTIKSNQNNDPKDIETLYFKEVSQKKIDMMELLYQQLDELDVKAGELKYSPDKKARKDAIVVRELSDGLRSELEKFVTNPSGNINRFEKICTVRVKDAQLKLKQYKSIQRVLVNILSAVGLVGLVYGLHSAAKHGKWKWIYNPKSETRKQMDKIEKAVEDTFKPKPH